MTGSRDFNGSSDAVRAALTSPNPTTALTLLAVVKPASAAGSVALLNAQSSTPRWGWRGGKLYLQGATTSSATFAPLADTWQVLATTKAAGAVRPRHHRIALEGGSPVVHEDGDATVANVTPLGWWDFATDSSSWSAGGDGWFDGLAAGWALFARALTDAEIESCTSWPAIVALAPTRATRLDGAPPFTAQSRIAGSVHANAEPAGFWPSSYYDEVLADAPAAWFRLSERSGTVAADAVGGAAGTYVGSVSLDQSGLVPADRTGSARFNGSGYVRVADRAALDLGDTFTLEAWVNFASTDLRAIVDKGAGAYILRTTETSRVLLRQNSTGDVVTSSVALVPNRTHHVVATKAGTTTRLYVDAVDVTGTVTNQTLGNNSHELNIGAADAGDINFVDGFVDDVALYPTALSAARVKAHYDAGLGLRCSYWNGSVWENAPVEVFDGLGWRRAAAVGVL